MKQSLSRMFMRHQGRFKVCLPSLIAVAFTCLAVQGRSQALQTDADFNAYCRVTYSNSTYQRIPQSWGTEHACVQSGTRQGIDLGEACFLTTGSRQFEISGTRVLCAGTPDTVPDPTAADLGEPNFTQFCREEFAGSTYEKRAEPQGARHYCRRPGSTGGFTLQPVNLAAACRTAWGSTAYREDGDRVFCVREGSLGATARGHGPVNPGGSGRPINPDAPHDVPNIPPANPPFPGPTFPDPVPSDPAANNRAAVPGLTGNAAVEVACSQMPGGGGWRSGTLALVDDILFDMESAWNTPCIGPEDLCKGMKIGPGSGTYIEILMIFQCHLAFLRFGEEASVHDFSVALDEACTIEPILNEIITRMEAASGFTMPTQHYLNTSEEELQELCDCKAGTTDFKALADELMQQADKNLLEEFVQ